MPKDIQGKEVFPGAQIAYSASRGNSTLLKVGTVTQVEGDSAWVKWSAGVVARTRPSPTKITLDPTRFVVLEDAA